MVLIVTVPLGTTHDIKIYVTDGGQVKNLTTATAVCTFVTAHGSPPVLTKKTYNGGIEVQGDQGLVTIHIVPGDASSIPVGVYLWECRLTFQGVQEVIEYGTLNIIASDSYGVLDE